MFTKIRNKMDQWFSNPVKQDDPNPSLIYPKPSIQINAFAYPTTEEYEESLRNLLSEYNTKIPDIDSSKIESISVKDGTITLTTNTNASIPALTPFITSSTSYGSTSSSPYTIPNTNYIIPNSRPFVMPTNGSLFTGSQLSYVPPIPNEEVIKSVKKDSMSNPLDIIDRIDL